MREILFRGKRKDNGKWIEGCLIKVGEYCCILEIDCDRYGATYLDRELGYIDGQAVPVIPETVGQFTGRFDKNGKKIFEDDLGKTKYNMLYVITWFASREYNGWDSYASEKLEVVGNIHDNPELLR